MTRKLILAAALAGSFAVSSTAFAHIQWLKDYNSNKSSGRWVHTSPNGNPTTPGGSHQVPEPGMLGMFGLGLIGLGYARYRRRGN